MKFENRAGSQVLPHLLAHELERPVVISDHPLAPVSGLTTRSKQLLGLTPGGRSALELARTDGLLHQRVDEEPLSCPSLRSNHLIHCDLTATTLIDVVKAPQHRVEQSIAEGMTGRIS